MAMSDIPVKGTVVIDTLFATTGQCGEAVFDKSPRPTCKANAPGTTVTCK